MDKVRDSVDVVLTKLAPTGPIAAFLYGSVARDGRCAGGDINLAVVYDTPPERRDMEDVLSDPSDFLFGGTALGAVTARPFAAADLHSGSLDTPFPASLFLHELRDTSISLTGPAPADLIRPPSIRARDLIDECRVAQGRLLALFDAARELDRTKATQQGLKARRAILRAHVLLGRKELVHATADLIGASRDILKDRPSLADLNYGSDPKNAVSAMHESLSLISETLMPKLRSMSPARILHRAPAA